MRYSVQINDAPCERKVDGQFVASTQILVLHERNGKQYFAPLGMDGEKLYKTISGANSAMLRHRDKWGMAWHDKFEVVCC